MPKRKIGTALVFRLKSDADAFISRQPAASNPPPNGINARDRWHIKKSIFNVRRAVGRQEFEIVWEGNNAYPLEIAQTLNHYYVCTPGRSTGSPIACTGKID